MAGIRRDKVDTHMLLNAVSTTGAGNSYRVEPAESKRTFQAAATNASGVCTSCTTTVEVSNDNNAWFTLGTITLGTITTTAVGDGFASDAPWAWVRGNLTTATTATVAVTLTMGV